MIRIKRGISMPPLESLRDAAIKSAHKAGEILLRHFGKRLSISEKKDAGLVTSADVAAEDAVIKTLLGKFPEFSFLSEEAGASGNSGAGRWIIDPLDGTTNYVHGFPMFCVSVAAEWLGCIVAGVVYHPVLRDTYSAILGGGAYLNGKRIKVSKTSRLRNSLLTTGFSYLKAGTLHDEMIAFEKLTETARAIRRPGSAALDLAYMARGVFDGFWERQLSPWDMAAGILLVTEAGGKVTDFTGNEFSLTGKQILASNRILHPSLIKVLAYKS
ncbi:MAG: inositol monophosphatase family protein [Bdellovibrionota bacterium]